MSEFIDWFWNQFKKDTDTGCWIWQGATYHGGYGFTRLPLSTEEPGRKFATHRLAYMLHHKIPLDLPPSQFVCHHCDNPTCGNPKHLFLGDHTANMRDAQAKGRLGKLDRNKPITQDEATLIRLDRSNGYKLRELAKKYELSTATVSKVTSGTYFKDARWDPFHRLFKPDLPWDSNRGTFAKPEPSKNIT